MSSFWDRVDKVNKQKQQTEEEEKKKEDKQGTGTSSFWDRVNKVNSGETKVGTLTTGDQANAWYKSVGDVGKRAYDFLSRQGYRKADVDLVAEIDKYLAESGNIAQYIRANKSAFEDYDGTVASHHDTVNYLRSLKDSVANTNNFYSQWETEDQYNFWDSRNTTEKRQQLYTDNQRRIAEMEEAYYDFRDLEQWYTGYQMNPDAWDADVVSENLSRYNKYKSQYGTADKIEMEMAQLKADNTNYERGNRNQYGQDYGNKTLDDYTAKYLSNPEFLQAASSREYGNASVEDHVRYKALNDSSTWAYDVDGTIRATDGTVIEDDGSGNLIHPGTVGMNAINDRLGMYISATEEDRLMPATLISGELSQVMTEGTTKHWELLTEDELTIYYGLLNTEGQESAKHFLDSIQTTLDMRSTERSIKATQEQYDDAGFLGRIMLNAATFPANIVGNVAGGVEDAIALVKGEDINPYSSAHAGMHYTQTVRGKTAQDIDKNAKPDAFFTWGDLYQSGMSIGDSLLAMGIGGTYGSALLAMGAAENEAYKLYQQGASTEQIAKGAALAGAAEMVSESISIGNLIKMKDATSLLQVVKNVLIQGGIEASEEFATEVANVITNAWVMRSQSDWNKLVEESGGYGEAVKQKFFDAIHAALSGFFSGAGSGGIVSGTNYGANYAQQQNQYADAGRIIMETDGGVDALKALAMDVSGARGSLARQAKRTTSSGKAANVGKLYQKTGEAVSKMNRADIESSLVEKGFSKKEAKRIGEYLHKASTGGLFTYKEQNEVQNDQRIVEVLRDVVGNPESTIHQRTQRFIEAVAGKAPTASTSTETAPKGNTSTGAGVPTETSYSVSEGGQTKLDGNAVQIRGLHELDDGTTVVATVDGQTADPSEVEYSHKGQALVFESYSNLKGQYSNPVIANMPVADRSALAMGYDPASGMDGRLYVVGSNEAYWYGYEGISLNTLPTSSFAKHLSQEQITRAYALGRAASEASAKAQSAGVQAAYEQAVEKLGGKEAAKAAVKKAGEVILEHGITESSMTKQQRASLKMTQAVASTSGTTVHVYRGGKERGYYDPNTGDVWLNINADANAQSYAVFTLGHELVHKAKDLSAAKFKKFADTLLAKYGEKGISVERLIQNKIEQYADYDITLDEHAAWEEVIADACQAMLLDTNAVETMAEFRDANPGFWQKIVDTIKEFIEKIRLALKGVEPDSEEAHHFKELDAAAQKILENLFVDMVMDASQKGAVIKAANGTLSVEQYMETKDIKYNLAAVKKHKSNLETKYSEESTVPLVTLMARYNKILDIWTKLGGELNSQFLKEWDSKVSTDRTFTIFKAQSGYKYNVELSSMCKKGVPLFEAIDTIVKQEVMKELGIETLGKAEKEILYDILKSHNFEIPCAICYVEQARQREGAIIDAFLNGKVVKNASGKTTQFKLGWNEVLDAIESEMRANGVEYSFAQVSRDLATEAYAPANLDMDEKTHRAFLAALKKVANQEITRYNKAEKKNRSLLGDLNPENAVSAANACFKGTLPSNLKIFKVLLTDPSSRFKIQHDLLYSSIATQNLSKAHHELYGLFNSQGGVSGYKTKQGTTIYWGDILSKSWTPDTLRKEGGVRNQSNSDFQIYTLLDQAQMYIDFTAKGYYLQAYTKVLSELKLFGLSRGKINASLIPRVVVYHNADGSVDVERTMATAGLDEKGNPIYDDIEGINHAEAFMLIADPEYSKSITGICIGYSDAHIRKLLDVDGVQLIIGFHDKTDDGEKRYRGARYAKNYNGLNEAVKYDADGKPKTVHIGFNPYVKKAEGRLRYNEETETFEGTTTFKGKEYTADDIPRLAADMYLDMCEKKGYVPAYADFKDHRNYYKLLADFGLYDSQGHYAPHRKVAYNMPDQVPYLDANGNKQYMKSYDYIREELRRELIVRDDISAALADQSSEGIIPQFKAKVEEMRGHTIPEGAKRSMPKEDSEGRQLSAEQQEFFRDSKVRDEQGRLMPMYHGTDMPNFTVFDPQFSDDGISLFFTSDPDVANTYTQRQDYGRDIDPYNLITGESSAEQFNAAQERVGGGLRVVKITAEWIRQMKAKAEQTSRRLLGVANKYADLLESINESGVFNYDIERIRAVTGDGTRILKESEIGKLRGAMGAAKDHLFFVKDKRAREISRIYSDTYRLFDEARNYALAATTHDSEIGLYTYTETNNSVPFMLGSLYPSTESEMVAKALDRTKWVQEHNLGNRYKVYLNLTNPFILDAGISYSGRMDRVSLTRRSTSDGWRVEFESAEHDEIKHMTTEDFMAFIETAFDAETTAKIKSQMEADTEAYRKKWGDDFYPDMDVDHDIRLANVDMEYVAPGNWNALNFNGNTQAKTRDVTAWAKANGYDGVIFRNMKDAGGYAFMKGRGGSTVATAFSSEQVKSVDNSRPTANRDIRYAMPNAQGEGYDTTHLHWAIKNGIINEADQDRFWEAIAEIRKRGYNSFARTKNGGYIIESKDKMMFTDGDFKAPTLSKVIVFTLDGGKDVDDTRRMIRDEARRTGRTDQSISLAERVYGSWFVAEYNARYYRAYGWENGQGEGANRSGTPAESEGRGVRHSGEDEVRKGRGLKSASPKSRGLSPRQLLADAFEEMVQTPQERQMIDEYRANISKVEDVQERLKKVRAKIHELTVSKGDKSKIAALNKTASELAALIDSYDRKLLEMEGSKPLRDVLTRAKQAAYRDAKQRGEELMAEYRQKVSERFDRGVESRKKTAMRAKIRKTIRDLDKILHRGDKKRNVKEGMKGFVEEALASAEILFTENYGNEDMIRNGVEVEMTPEEEKYMTEARAILAELYNLPSGSYEAWAERQGVEESLKSKLAYRMGKLKDVFYRERLRLNKTKVADVLSKLADAYAKLESSEYAYVSGAYNEAIHQYLKTLQEEVGGATIRDMSLNQLELMHTAYTMVLHSVRKANEMFTEGWTKRRDELANGIMFEVKEAGGVHGRWSAAEVARNRASWNNTKPIYAAERIGSDTFKQLWAGLFRGQYNWAVDMEEAKAFRQKLAEKYGVKNWDMEELYTFTSASGLEFQLNLNQIMSIYAYSKREQAHDHLTRGGFVFGKDTEVIVNKHGIKVTYYDRSATAYKVSDEIIGDIVSMLDTVPGAKQFVDEMQDYLSTTMGEKGNEVSMKLYGVRLFNEAFYFPLRSAGQYMERAKEADLKKQQGQVSIVNSSFTHATKPKANNPVVLEGFMDVWASHVNEMSMYHSMVLPMEDFRRVYNYSSPNMEGQDSVSVNSVIENAYGPEATGYIDQLYKELNGGAVTDPRETAFKERIGKFKKAAVMLSSSVVVQQFSAIGRAYALIDPKYFIGAKVDKHRQAAAWEEMKRYAPVAIIKEMGGFDTGMGGSAKDFLLAEEYGKGERIKGLLKDEQYRSEIMGMAPAKADELTWCAIWEAVKRETKAKHPELDVKSEEFLKAAGERFSEVIEKTQVYDSVLARSANMRSKNGLMQMATAFMAEPTTTVNMIEDALRKKDKKYIARTFASVFASIVINNALASLVYAMRDDDDDETFLEKYTQALVSGMLDDLNPMTYYPFLKDVWSLLQGYDVERSDMSVVSDVTDAVKRLATTFAKFDEDMDEEEMAEYYKEIGTGLMGLLDAGCTALGIPEKNVRREITAIVNTFKTFSKTFGSTTWNSFVDAIGSSALDSIPIVGLFGGESRTDKLYNAIVSGDTTYLARLKAGYKSEDSYNAAVRKALRENDPRIHQAALAGYNGDPSERVRIARLIIADGFSQDNVVAAINAEINNMKPDEPKSDPKAKGFYTAEDFAREIANGDQAAANAAKVDVIQTAQKNGKSAEEATKSFVSSAKAELKDLFLVGRISEQKAINALTTYCDMDEADAIADVQYWAFKNDYPDVFVDDQWFDTYYEKIADSGIEIDVYMEYRNAVAGITGENKKSGRMSVINSLPITNAQKDALYLAEGWAASKLNEAPWH